MLAWSLWQVSGNMLTALELSPYDHWLRNRTPGPISSAVIMITRDRLSETRFGSGPWDHALLARTITALRSAGAVVVGLDIPIGEHSPPARGGAASDALLVEATKTAGRILYPLSVQLSAEQVSKQYRGRSLWQVVLTAGTLPILAQHAGELGHALSRPDEDGVIRRVPLYVLLGDRPLPAFGLALAQVFLQVAPAEVLIRAGQPLILGNAKFPDGHVEQLSVPMDEHGQILINYMPVSGPSLFPSLPFLSVWTAIEEGEVEKLREWVSGKIVYLLPSPAHAAYATPVGQGTSETIQANLLNMVLTKNWIREFSTVWRFVCGLMLAGLAAWLLLGLPGWQGLGAVVALLCGYIAAVFLALPAGGVLLPVVIPVAAVLLAAGVATLWLQYSGRHQIKLLESSMLTVQQELGAVREALTCQESNVEDLEEDLEVARTSAVRSAGKEQELAQSVEVYRKKLAEANAEEDGTRRRLVELESKLRGLRIATTGPVRLGNAELERLREECEAMGILTCDPVLLALFRDLKKSAHSVLPVLILGEAGTGKELFARAVHRLSPRAGYPFVSVNTSAISPHLFESELFGHVRGSFTGAVGDRKGYFELADRGTIFLDEIGDLQLEHQGKLLRVLQEKTFYRVGAVRPTTVNVRVVAATNKDLRRGVSEGWFREDLYFRLKGLVIRLPPLRERPRDVALLAERFLRDAAAQVGRGDLALSAEAQATLDAQLWKGNVRELQHCLQQAAALVEGNVITKEALRLMPSELTDVRGPITTGFAPDPGSDQAVLACLRQQRFDMRATARALGWDRSTVTQRLKGMGFRALVESGGDRAKAAVALGGDPELARTVELKLSEYYEHLLQSIKGFGSEEEAVAACKKRYKNLPDRHFHSVESLIRQQFHRASSPKPGDADV